MSSHPAPASAVRLEGLAVTYPDGTRAVRELSLELDPGECLALVGETGSGKSSVAKAILGLLPSATTVTGRLHLAGRTAPAGSQSHLRPLRGRHVAMVFQNPMTSLNPRLTVGAQLTDVLARHTGLSRRDRRRRAVELLTAMGLDAGIDWFDTYPRELSGGMQQRAMLAIAMSCDPQLLVVDEGTTALDVTTQAQILDLLRRTQRERHLALLLITHDIAVASSIAQRVLVMFAGRAVEVGPVDAVLLRPEHPYTRRLVAAVSHDPRAGQMPRTAGARQAVPHDGCAFRPWCERYLELGEPGECRRDRPPPPRIGYAACHFVAAGGGG